MYLLAVVTPPSTYHGCSTCEIFWEEYFALVDLTPVNMKKCGHWNIKKYRDIENDD